MIIDSVYDGYTNWLYKSNPGLENQPYAIQHSKTIHGGFHNATVWAKPLRKLGCEVTDVFHNQVPLQIRWCVENGYKNVLEKYLTISAYAEPVLTIVDLGKILI